MKVLWSDTKILGGNSGVVAFEIAQESITVQFNNGWLYLYTNGSAGMANIAEMQRLAKVAQGLNTYISRMVKGGFARKWR